MSRELWLAGSPPKTDFVSLADESAVSPREAPITPCSPTGRKISPQYGGFVDIFGVLGIVVFGASG